MIQRYDMTVTPEGEICAMPANGGWCPSDDVAALEARCTEQEAVIDEMRWEANELADTCDRYYFTIDDLREELAAARRRIEWLEREEP